jgi:hypothetical protein
VSFHRTDDRVHEFGMQRDLNDALSGRTGRKADPFLVLESRKGARTALPALAKTRVVSIKIFAAKVITNDTPFLSPVGFRQEAWRSDVPHVENRY